ncbi:translation machinery-associated protein 16 homolog [Prorops nasuta]|uniref:translation machinery-associated protein 16 homolog n=1 Tax=Prorops nasuta TaxID=863751 RepID=UPI0034CD2716
MSVAMKRELSKARKVGHPNSRKTISIMKKVNKISSRKKSKLGGLIKQNLIGDKMLWIQQHMKPDICPYTPELTAELLEAYLARHDEELEQIQIKHSIGGKRKRQHASREDVLRLTKERERGEYETCGLEIPDILNAAQCKLLLKWEGELNLLSKFIFRRFGKKHLNEAIRNKKTQKNRNPRGSSEVSTCSAPITNMNKTSETKLDSRDTLIAEEIMEAE